MNESVVWIIGIVCLTIYSLYKLKHSKDPKEELLNARKLLEEDLISREDYQKIKNRLVKKITED